MRTVRREQELREVIRADGEEIQLRQQYVERFRQRRNLQHCAIIYVCRQHLALLQHPFPLLIEQGAGLIELPRLGNHREHHI